jgi:hypothetical protein
MTGKYPNGAKRAPKKAKSAGGGAQGKQIERPSVTRTSAKYFRLLDRYVQAHGKIRYEGPEPDLDAVAVRRRDGLGFDLILKEPCPCCQEIHRHGQDSVALGELTNRSPHCDRTYFEMPGYTLRIVEIVEARP